ncbi:hypothetical protein PBRA_007785 [Plasmodiophora brassicae]|nr:hypothetical protein PBRA_007785 [Plasmodiophora brassicae]
MSRAAEMANVAGQPQAPGAAGAHVPAPPASHQVRAAIERLAPYAARNGPQFESMLMREQRSNPEFRFLFEAGSPDNLYYRHLVQQYSAGHDPDGQLCAVPRQPTRTADSDAGAAHECDEGFRSNDWQAMLDRLDMRKSAIKAAADWLWHSSSVASSSWATAWQGLQDRLASTRDDDFPARLAVLYLVNEILHRVAHDAQQSGKPILAHPLLAHCHTRLPAMIGQVVQQESSSNRAHVTGIVNLWAQRKLLPVAMCQRIVHDIERPACQDDADMSDPGPVMRPPVRSHHRRPSPGSRSPSPHRPRDRQQHSRRHSPSPPSDKRRHSPSPSPPTVSTRSRLLPPDFTSDLPDLPPNAVLSSTFVVLPSEVVDACRGMPPYTPLNALAAAALARRSYLTPRNASREDRLLDDFFDDLRSKLRPHSTRRRQRASRSRSWSRGRLP